MSSHSRMRSILIAAVMVLALFAVLAIVLQLFIGAS